MQINLTGNIFFDAGYYLFYHILNKPFEDKEFSPEEIQKVIDWMIQETDRWLSYLDSNTKQFKSRFIPYLANHDPLSHAQKAKLDKSEKINTFKEILLKLLTHCEVSSNNTCSICGQFETIKIREIDKESYGLTRVELPLSNFGVNFYPGWVRGIQTCGICALKAYATIFATLNSSGKVILLNSFSSEIMKIWIETTRDESKLSKYNIFDEKGPITLPISNRLNAIYSLLKPLVDEGLKKKLPPYVYRNIEFIYYSNFVNGPEIQFFPISHHIFMFFFKLKQNALLLKWNQFVYQFYTSNKIQYDESKQKLIITEKKDNREAQEEEYQNNYNILIEKLLNGKPLFKEFVKDKKLRIEYKIIELYILEVLKVEKERLDLIKQIADLIAKNIRQGDMKLFDVEDATEYFKFQRFLVMAAKKHVQNMGNPLFTVDDYVNNLIGDYKTVHNIMLIRLYELLADFITKQTN
ncbi:MAG: hypothetical protein OEV44_06255 [Spirochaetota bacterium]|nr:hypothetical protein [Spirochaetota bacterium]